MRRVVIESPFAGDFKARNLKYALACMRDCLMRGEAPFASHVLYTQSLDDDNERERELGMNAGFVWGRAAAACLVYMDFGISAGMGRGIEFAKNSGIPIEYRVLPTEMLSAVKA